MQLSPALPHAATVTPPSRSEHTLQARPGRRNRSRSYLLQGYAARRRPKRFRIG